MKASSDHPNGQFWIMIYCHGVLGVGGSNPLAPTIQRETGVAARLFPFCFAASTSGSGSTKRGAGQPGCNQLGALATGSKAGTTSCAMRVRVDYSRIRP